MKNNDTNIKIYFIKIIIIFIMIMGIFTLIWKLFTNPDKLHPNYIFAAVILTIFWGTCTVLFSWVYSSLMYYFIKNSYPWEDNDPIRRTAFILNVTIVNLLWGFILYSITSTAASYQDICNWMTYYGVDQEIMFFILKNRFK